VLCSCTVLFLLSFGNIEVCISVLPSWIARRGTEQSETLEFKFVAVNLFPLNAGTVDFKV
jgi:hypothetical protein